MNSEEKAEVYPCRFYVALPFSGWSVIFFDVRISFLKERRTQGNRALSKDPGRIRMIAGLGRDVAGFV